MDTHCDQVARDNWSANLAALENVQPDVAAMARTPLPPAEWVLGRDGALTARIDGRWLADCSLPARVAEALLKDLICATTTICFLSPQHAAQVRAALNKLRPEQAVVAVCPVAGDLALMLHCDNFAAELQQHRLLFACGEQWPAALQQIFEQYPGLPLPSQFIKLPTLSDEVAQGLIGQAQSIFSAETLRRGRMLKELTASAASQSRHRICVLTRSRFRLWDDAAERLTGVLAQADETEVVDLDEPISAGPLAIAQAASRCCAVVTADLGRGQVPGGSELPVRWITWVTKPFIPAAADRGDDILLLADAAWAEPATRTGWLKPQLREAAWPIDGGSEASDRSTIVLIADLPRTAAPKKVEDLSSQMLLWEHLREQLRQDPFAAGRDPREYLRRSAKAGGIPLESLDEALFLDRLIVPAWLEGIARVLAEAQIPFAVYGEGWEAVERLALYAAGPVGSRAKLQQIVTSAAALVHPLPWNAAHSIDQFAPPILRATGTRASFLQETQAALRGALAVPRRAVSPLSASLIRQCLSA